ncbi:arylesterase [Sphingomonas ginkgonis]|uniref:Arylesterase n=1 Tax=Sphingomonas ginkgonis TaxID=2315330 RepID=A0A3R9X5Y9_9SPHN|nr:arylesterase [Sphingomonas ginkgonis]RST29557.1 arylesterase [Sphingomonas ginkgonis]
MLRTLSALLLLAGASPVAAAPPRPLILAFGDSLTAGYGLGPGLGFAPQLQATLRRNGVAATVADGGVSGDTSAAAQARLGWTLQGLPRKPDLVIVELGANDMLRGLDPQVTAKNLDAILAELKRRNIRVLLAGMLASRNLDPGYRARFEPIYPSLAKRYDARLYPFFMDGVAQNRALLQGDGMHPTLRGVQTVVTRILPMVTATLKD